MNTTADRIDVSHMPAAPGVYRVVCVPTGECYVGGTGNMRSRASNHACGLAYGDHVSKLMVARYREHGASAFRVEVLDACEVSDVNAREVAWIAKLSPAFNTQKKAGIIRPSRPAPRAPARRVTINRTVVRLPVVSGSRREAKAERRRQMAQSVIAGTPMHEVAAKYGVSIQTVAISVREAGTSPFQIKQSQRTARIIELATTTEQTAEEIADTIGVCAALVGQVLRTAGISRRRGRRKGVPNVSATFIPRQVWESTDWTKRDTDIATELLVTRERVRQVRRMLGKENSLRHRQRALSA